MKDALALVLRLLGEKASSDLADTLSPPFPRERWRRIESFCNTNPHDPSAPEGTNLDNARNAANSTRPEAIWTQMSVTIEDHNFEDFTPALARFDPPIIVKLLRAVAGTAVSRTGLQLRQLGWRLPEISPLFDQVTVLAVRRAYDALLADPSRRNVPDANVVVSSLVRALMPHYSPEVQLDLLLSLPDDCPLYLNLLHSLKPLPPEILEHRLEVARAAATSQDFTRILFFASGSKAELTPRSRSSIAGALTDSNASISISAADIIFKAEDFELNAPALQQASAINGAVDHPDVAFHKGRAIAAAVRGNRRQDMVAGTVAFSQLRGDGDGRIGTGTPRGVC
jgi:hypothetical protein